MRKFLYLLLWLALPLAQAQAATAEDARHFVDSVGKDVLGNINTPNLSEADKQQKLRQMFMQYVDIPWMGRFVLGRAWQKATPEQRERYLAAYKDYLLNRYTSNFADYSGSKYAITDVNDDGNGQFTVHMDIAAPHQQQNLDAGYRLSEENGQFKIRDIIIEGVSLITTQRSDFAAIAQRQGIEALINDLQRKSQAKGNT